jgi:hypothetical protein
MIGVIDTSSILSLSRYYLHHDNGNILLDYFEEKIRSGDIVVLDKVCDEAGNVADGIALKTIKYLPKYKTNTTRLLPDKTFYNHLRNDFYYGFELMRLSDVAYESEQNRYLRTADPKLFLYCLSFPEKIQTKDIAIISEETIRNNDKKPFKKIPSICKILQIEHLSLPQYIGSLSDLTVNYQKS